MEKEKFLQSTWTLVVAVMLLGPLALPLLWRNPKYRLITKISWSIIILFLTMALLWGSAALLETMNEQLEQLQKM